MLRVIDVRVLYIFTFLLIIPPTIIVNGAARKSTYNFYRKGFGYGRLKACLFTYKNFCAFSQVVIDKFAMYAGKKFKITIDRFDLFTELVNLPGGFIQLSSHIGNYEIAGYSLKTVAKRFNALVFAGEKATVMANRSKLFVDNNIRMVPMSADMEYLFVIDKALDDGEIVSMPADRVFGSQKTFEIDFLGKKAKFPQGPFVLSAMKKTPMLFVAVMKKGAKKYHIVIKNIDRHPEESENVRQRAEMLAKEYVKILEKTVRLYPVQWYNYFDIWQNK